ncbi:MAG: J domain-containing protein [Hyphomicrobiales bacterium]|nr:J domain-containing protein [Hyphomicrobiales bacterium]
MADDPYTVLGVAKDADDKAIRAAYRKLAKGCHPDLHPGDKAAEARFRAIAAAYDILGDKDKRARYDRGEIDASGAEKPRSFYRNYADGDGAFRYHRADPGEFVDLGDIFGDMFAHRPGGGGGEGFARTFRFAGGDLRYHLAVDFLDAVNGATRRVTLPDGRTLDVTIPPGLENGQVLRLRGQGLPGGQGAPAGDALVEVEVRPHPVFTRRGGDIHMDLSVSLPEAVLGARIPVPTVSGTVTLTVPAGSNTGTVLRLKGKGVPGRRGAAAGDQYVTLRVVLPDRPDDELKDFLRRWGDKHPYAPRGGKAGEKRP